MAGVMKVFILSTLSMAPLTSAGPAYPMCYGGCLGTCFTIGAAAMAASGPFAPVVGVSDAVACPVGCAVFCIASCFSDEAMVSASKNGTDSVPASITGLQRGQQVWTLEGGKPVLTEVIRNTRVEGSFPFIRILASNGSHTYNLTVTEEHILPRLRESVDISTAEVVEAKKLRPGDTIAVLSPQGSMSAQVLSIQELELGSKNILVTRSGTVLANGILTTTLCAGAEPLFDPSNFSTTMAHWRALHEGFFAII